VVVLVLDQVDLEMLLVEMAVLVVEEVVVQEQLAAQVIHQVFLHRKEIMEELQVLMFLAVVVVQDKQVTPTEMVVMAQHQLFLERQQHMLVVAVAEITMDLARKNLVVLAEAAQEMFIQIIMQLLEQLTQAVAVAVDGFMAVQQVELVGLEL
jgi:hypothetical protein